MSFNWNFTGGQNAYDAAQQAMLRQKAAMDMQGYAPNGSEASDASQYMNGYNPNNTYLGRVSDRAGQPGSGMNYNFSDPEFYQFQREQAAQEQDAAEKEQRINSIKTEIASLRQSIAQKEAQLKNWSGNATEIAALEAQKINSQDPTMIWRWQKQREDTANANKTIGLGDEEKFKNKANMLISQRASTSTAGIEQQIRNIESAIVEGQNAGADVTGLINKKEELEDKIYGSGEASGDFTSGTAQENFKSEAKDFMNSGKSSSELKAFYDKNKSRMDNDTNYDFRRAIENQVKKEKDKYEADLVSYTKSLNPTYDMMTSEAKKNAKESAKAKRGY